MEAIVRADGRQLRLTEGQEFEVNRVDGNVGDTVTYDDVLMVLNGKDVAIGTPTLAGASVKARIAQHGASPKIRFMKYKNKVRYRRTFGHRQQVSRLVVESISRGN
jgi:large subunit ribosomal protein L21